MLYVWYRIFHSRVRAEARSVTCWQRISGQRLFLGAEHRVLARGTRLTLATPTKSRSSFRVAAVLRLLPDFSRFCQSNPLIPLIWFPLERTLDLRIGVRIPASQPFILQHLLRSVAVMNVATFQQIGTIQLPQIRRLFSERIASMDCRRAERCQWRRRGRHVHFDSYRFYRWGKRGQRGVDCHHAGPPIVIH